jgi:hypothetical protein
MRSGRPSEARRPLAERADPAEDVRGDALLAAGEQFADVTPVAEYDLAHHHHCP